MKYFYLLAILFIIFLAIFLRVYRLDQVPPALFGDEVDVGYQAYSLLHTGKDLSGRFMPTYLKSLAEFRAPLYIYSAVPFVGIFGLNEWGVRMTSVFWGVVSILFLFLLVWRLINVKVALLSSGLMAISPWHLQYSRAGFEVTMLLSFILMGIYFFTLGLKKRWFYLLSASCFGLSIYIYSTALVFVPLLILLLLLINKEHILSKEELGLEIRYLLAAAFLIVLLGLPAMWSVYIGEARERFSIISIFSEKILLDKMNIARKGAEYFTPEGIKIIADPTYERFFHNNYLIFSQVFFYNYTNAFSFNYLFSSGDPNFRQSIYEMGELYGVELLTIILGLFYGFTKLKKKVIVFLIGWLLLSPIPAALTHGGGLHATRLFIMLPPLIILSGMGFLYIYELVKNNYRYLLVTIVGGLLLLQVFMYMHRYYIHYPVESWRWWHVGLAEALAYVDKNQDKYQTVVINNTYEPMLIRYLFYSKYNPVIFHQQFTGDRNIERILPGVDGFRLGEKIYFGQIREDTKKSGNFEEVMKPGMLYIASARDELEGSQNGIAYKNFKVIKTIVNPLGDPIYHILEGRE